MTDGKPRIGDEVYIHGYIDEIRNDVVIIRNEGGYFGTSDREIFYYEEDERGYGTMNEADRKTENSSEKPNNCEPKICDTCRYYNSNIPCGSTPSACKEADKFAEEFVDGLKKLKPTISKMEQVEDEQITSKLIDIENSAVSGYESTMSQPKSKLKDEPQTEECEEPNYYDPALWE